MHATHVHDNTHVRHDHVVTLLLRLDSVRPILTFQMTYKYVSY